MTNEQKLLELLRISVENGYIIEGLKYPSSMMERFWNTATIYIGVNGISIEGNLTDISYSKKHFTICHSLNDLVTNFEEGEVSFIEALCNASKHIDNFKVDNICREHNITRDFAVRYQWVFTPTSYRLDFLFDTFSHLLNN
jgi:hypothetical protein